MRSFAATLVSCCAVPVFAVQVGDTREAVLAELGKPQNAMTAGPREYLTYPGGRVEITAGKVSDLRGMPGKTPEPPPAATVPAAPAVTTAPAPVVASVTKPAAPAPSAGHWYTDMAEAQAVATRENKRILALFTGTDWCGPCQQFKAEVEDDPQFAGIFSGSFVFFKSDWLRNTPQPEAVKDEVGRLKRKYFVTVYPTLLVLDAHGERLDRVDWTGVQEGSYRERMIEAVDNARKATKGGKNNSSWLWKLWPF